MRDERELWRSGHRVIRGKGPKIGGAAVGESLTPRVPHTRLPREFLLRIVSLLFVMRPVHSELHRDKSHSGQCHDPVDETLHN